MDVQVIPHYLPRTGVESFSACNSWPPFLLTGDVILAGIRSQLDDEQEQTKAGGGAGWYYTISVPSEFPGSQVN